MDFQWSEKDLQQIREHGLDASELELQLKRFKSGFPKLELCEAATVGNGIKKYSDEKINHFITLFEQKKNANTIVKFVPASGAASRMFKSLVGFVQQKKTLTWEEVETLARSGDKMAADVRKFISNIQSFSFYPEIKRKFDYNENEYDKIIENFQGILAFVVTEDGLNLPSLPKALIPFHLYDNISRTAIEEHLVEAKAYSAGKSGKVKLHFTVSDEHLKKINSLIKDRVSLYFDNPDIVDISMSTQLQSTDTIAADMNGKPFRDKAGRLTFRPGGHGTLLKNLQQIDSDIIFIKNIDNVTTDSRREKTIRYKKALAGILISLKDQIFQLLEKIDNQSMSQSEFIKETLQFITDYQLRIPFQLEKMSDPEQVKYLKDFLNRPIRVCGMVINKGEPGGGPFWAHCKEGEHSLQVVETNLIDLNNEEQKRIFSESTHFSPVDFICSTKDYKGDVFELSRFVDDETGMISIKYQDGKELQALEVPGLWNGGMSGWLSIFVEVPLETFTPVKTVLDLLRPEHQN